MLEVNLSPSLACEAPLDLKIKSHVVVDFINLALTDCVPPVRGGSGGGGSSGGGGGGGSSSARLRSTGDKLFQQLVYK